MQHSLFYTVRSDM